MRFYLERIESALDANERVKIRRNFDKIEKNFNGIVDVVSNKAYEQVVDNAKLNWLEPVPTFADLATTYLNADEGDAVMAREVIDGVNKVYRYNGTEWIFIQQISADAINEVDNRLSTQLAQSYVQNRPTGVQFNKDIIPTALFVDDDIQPGAYSILFKEFVQGRNIPFLFAAISGRLQTGAASTVTMAQFREMKDHKNVTIGIHTKSHPQLATLTAAQQYEEIASCVEFLQSEGIYTRCFIPPFGSANADTRRIAKKFADTILISGTANGTTSAVNCAYGDFLNTDRVVRIDFSEPLDVLKSHGDLAKQHNALLVVATHTHYSRDEVANPTQNFVPEKLHALIDYYQSIGIDIADYETAYARFKNVIEYRANDALNVGLSAGGKAIGLSDYKFSTQKVHADDPPTFDVFQKNTTIKMFYGTGNYEQYGYPIPGTVVTSCADALAFTHQTLYGIRKNDIRFRAWNDYESKWEEFIDLTGQQAPKVHANDAPTLIMYPRNTIKQQTYTLNEYVQYGYPAAGTVVTSCGADLAHVHQLLLVARSNTILKRYWNDVSGSWSDWEDKSSIKGIVTFAGTYGDVETKASKVHQMSVLNIKNGDAFSIVPKVPMPLPTGILYNVTAIRDGYVDLCITNLTASNFNISGTQWVYTITK
ncbi:MAG: polysaccharide deacetylase family protein [Solibacillus sp.]